MRFHFDEPVVGYMTRDVEVARVDTPVEQIARTLEARGISGVPILDSRGHLVGVVTRTDLIQLGVMQSGRRPTGAAMKLPHRRASEVMTHGAVEVSSSTSLRHAGRVMIDNNIHRVFVTEAGELAGVLCAVDLTATVRDAKIDTPVAQVMTSPIVTIDRTSESSRTSRPCVFVGALSCVDHHTSTGVPGCSVASIVVRPPPPAVPRFIVTNSRKTLSFPIASSVRSP